VSAVWTPRPLSPLPVNLCGTPGALSHTRPFRPCHSWRAIRASRHREPLPRLFTPLYAFRSPFVFDVCPESSGRHKIEEGNLSILLFPLASRPSFSLSLFFDASLFQIAGLKSLCNRRTTAPLSQHFFYVTPLPPLGRCVHPATGLSISSNITVTQPASPPFVSQQHRQRASSPPATPCRGITYFPPWSPHSLPSLHWRLDVAPFRPSSQFLDSMADSCHPMIRQSSFSPSPSPP
jgi:hypothetical protein